MNSITPRRIKTGGDPRRLGDFTALRDELSKLTHPARPDINWPGVEKRCLSLFEQNGVELQTAAWYTLARTQQAGLPGLNEGLAILVALISHQWGSLWPQAVHTRMEILSGLSQRLQRRMRILPLCYSDLSQLYRAEQLLTSLNAVLQRLELKHLSQMDTLHAMIHNNAVTLENSEDLSGCGGVAPAGSGLPASIMQDARISENAPARAETRVYVTQPENPPVPGGQAAIPAVAKPWKPFAAGMFSMLVLCTAAAWGWHNIHQPDPLQAQLAASLAPLPRLLAPAQLEALRQQMFIPDVFIEDMQQQLERLAQLPPDWNIDYSRKLIAQAGVLWPEQAHLLIQQRQQQLKASALPAENLQGWQQGMATLQQLSDRLSGLDKQKGKYITVSELKSVVFTTMQAFNQSVPAEEQLRVLSQTPAGEPLPVAGITQLELHLKQLAAHYSEIKQNAAK